MSSTPATERAFSISELLTLIFEYSTSEDNLNHALVCRRWSDEALNARWRVVDNALDLLRLLAPLESLGSMISFNFDGVHAATHRYTFARRIAADDWKCFDKYAWRVHELTFIDFHFDPFDFEDIASSRPRDILLPNLRKLRAPLNTRVLPLFAHPSLREVYLDGVIRAGGGDVNLLTFPCLPTVASRLEVLRLTDRIPLTGLVAALDATIRKLPTLKHLHLPGTLLTPAITNAVATLPNLLTIDTRDSEAGETMDGDEELFSPSLPAGSFPALKHLHIDVQYHRFASSFSQACSSSSLSSLSLMSPTTESSSDFAHLLDVVSRCCPDLEELHLMNMNKDHTTVPIEPVTFAHFAPLLSCSKLRKIDLFHPNPFNLYAEDIISMVKPLPCLTELHLCQWGDTCSPTLHISVLSALAVVATNLEILGVEMDTSVDDRLDANGIASFAQFPKLRRLEVGSSPLSDPLPIAVYLSRVLPGGCAIKYRDWYHPDSPGTLLAERWEQARQFFSAAQGICDEERKWQPAAV